ncbi:uncharacterized protein TNCV_4543131 [Trichonephila clavipes]|nr:uncharacterized protein TNCV_4543131 [Trichonephila clavipes]
MRLLEDAGKNGWAVAYFQRHDGSGRPKVTADREDRLFVRSAVTDKYYLIPRYQSSDVQPSTRVSTMTIHRWLIEQNLPSYQPLRHLPLMPAQSQARLQCWLAR